MFLLVGCGEAEKVVQIQEVPKEVIKEVPFYIDEKKVDPKILPHVMEFAGYCEKFKISELCKKNFQKISSIKVVSSFPEQQVVGKCFVSSSGNRWIEILDKWVDDDSFTMKTVTMHEVAHCVLGDPFPHYKNTEDIMNPYLLPEKIIHANWTTLIKAMFIRAGGALSLTNGPEIDTVTRTMFDESGGLACEEEY